MAAHPTSFSLCPLKPPPEPSRVVIADAIAASRVPSNACDEEKCAWYCRSITPEGKVVAAYCAVVGMVVSFGQLAAAAQGILLKQSPPVDDGKKAN